MTDNRAISLSQLNGMIADALQAQIGSRTYWVTAELSDIRNYPDRRYCFFRLLEKQGGEVVASADAVIWRNEYPLISRFEKQAGTRFTGNLSLLLLQGSGMQFQLQVFASQVQGAGASEQLSKRMAEIADRKEEFDLIAMVRGGGSSTDLNVFDDFRLALEIARSPLPVFTGIGHERNVSIADMMAHTALKTPTKVAAEIVLHNQRWLALVIDLAEKIFQKADRKLDDAESRLHGVWQRMLMQARWKLERAENQIRMLGQRMELAHPARLGAQGFAKVFRDGKALRPEDPIAPGDILQLQFGNRLLETEVRSIKNDTDG